MYIYIPTTPNNQQNMIYFIAHTRRYTISANMFWFLHSPFPRSSCGMCSDSLSTYFHPFFSRLHPEESSSLPFVVLQRIKITESKKKIDKMEEKIWKKKKNWQKINKVEDDGKFQSCNYPQWCRKNIMKGATTEAFACLVILKLFAFNVI